MWKYVLKRIGLALVTAFVVVTASYFLYKILPFEIPTGKTEIVYSYFQKQIYLGFVHEELIDCGTKNFLYKLTYNDRTYYYYQYPVYVQYFRWLKNIVTKWDWGVSTSIVANNDTISIIMLYLPVSVKINFLDVVIALPLGILLGIVAALNKNTWVDALISTIIMILIAVPGFVLITVLIKWFGYDLNWLPTTWPNPTAALSEKIKGYIIPVTVTASGTICGWARAMRGELCEVMTSDYLLLARCKGLTNRQAIMRHALKNSMVPLFPGIISSIIGIIGGGSMILEIIYGIPGLGRLMYDAIMKKDYNVYFTDLVIIENFGLILSILLDLSYGFIDPRIRMGAKNG